MLFQSKETTARVVCYSNLKKQQLEWRVIPISWNNSTSSVLFQSKEITAQVVCYSNLKKQQHE